MRIDSRYGEGLRESGNYGIDILELTIFHQKEDCDEGKAIFLILRGRQAVCITPGKENKINKVNNCMQVKSSKCRNVLTCWE